ncbi:MAG: 1-acyl-sn-glycerol-3-phosphate acyltransferase [Bacilli bacterium]|nr:1-acyl-sn-glycerol-3-phosphate acyltransferase [Bacilli bacterium]
MALFIICAGISIALTGLTYYFAGLYQQWYWFWSIPLMLYGYFLVCFATWLLILFLVGLFVKEDEDYIYPPNRFCQWMVKQTCRVICFILGMRVHITGLGKLPNEGPVMIIHNHLSVFDEIALAAYYPHLILFISKPENFRIPVGGPWMRYAGYLPMKQGDMNAGKRVIEKAAGYIKRGINVCIAPEGTRNKDFPNPVLLPFHPGSFHLSLQAKCPIVVLAIQNTNCVLKRFPRHFTHIYIDCVGVLRAEEYENLPTHEIAAKTRDMIEKRLNRKDARFYHFKPKKKKGDPEEEA